MFSQVRNGMELNGVETDTPNLIKERFVRDVVQGFSLFIVLNNQVIL